jgi:hypothetical protein
LPHTHMLFPCEEYTYLVLLSIWVRSVPCDLPNHPRLLLTFLLMLSQFSIGCNQKCPHRTHINQYEFGTFAFCMFSQNLPDRSCFWKGTGHRTYPNPCPFRYIYRMTFLRVPMKTSAFALGNPHALGSGSGAFQFPFGVPRTKH